MIVQSIITKLCSRCGQAKSVDGFSTATSRPDGLSCYCKVCQSLYNKKKTNTIYRKKEDVEYLPKEKICGRCKLIKPQSEFNFSKSTVDGLTSQCHVCRKENSDECRLKANFDITLRQYDLILKSQNNGCAICNKTPEENGKRLAVDHNHTTGKVRGLLCTKCNLGIGSLNDSSEQLRKAADYLDA